MKALPDTKTRLRLSTSRKVAPDADRYKGAKVKNAFSLPAGRAFSCPGATAQCDPHRGGYCYAGRDERRFTSVHRLLVGNFELLKGCGRSVEKMVDLIDEMVVAWETWIEAKGYPKLFRWHEDGDFFNMTYARAVAIVMERHPEIQFWAYTRSFTSKLNVVPVLASVPNLSLYCSVDPDNLSIALGRVKEWKQLGVKVAFAQPGEDVQEMSLELLGRKAPVCPEVAGKIPLVNDQGVGACITCGLCLTDTPAQPVIFPIHR